MPWRCAASTMAPVMYSCSSGRPARRSCNIEVPPSAGRGRFEAVERFRIFEWHDQSRPCFFKIYLQSRAEVGNARLWPESHHRAENICRCLSRAIPDSGGSAAIANRHSFASFLVNEGVSLYVVQGLLGHTQVRATQRYAHLADDTLSGAAEVVGRIVAPPDQAARSSGTLSSAAAWASTRYRQREPTV